MKKTILLVVALAVITVTLKAEKAAYIAKMKETLQEMGKCQTPEDFKKVANTFDRISKMEPEEWLPLYYAANIHVLLVYVESQASLETKDKYLDKAAEYIKQMEQLAPKEVEVQVIKAFLLASRMGLDPAARGAVFYQDYETAVNKAYDLAPENPRARYMVFSRDVGRAQWFGQSIAQYCPKMQELYAEWDSYPVVSDIHPSWGKEQVAQLMQSCN